MLKRILAVAFTASIAISGLTVPTAGAVDLPEMPFFLKAKLEQKTRIDISPEFAHKLNDGKPDTNKWIADAIKLINESDNDEGENLLNQINKIDPKGLLTKEFDDFKKAVEDKTKSINDAKAQQLLQGKADQDKNDQEARDNADEAARQKEYDKLAEQAKREAEAQAQREADLKQEREQQEAEAKARLEREEAQRQAEVDKLAEQAKREAEAQETGYSVGGFIAGILAIIAGALTLMGIGTTVNTFLKNNGLPHF
ncbi:hypothetical protein FRC0360_01984 [Corynebacterium diphtheriae]|nr:hypothetical protein NY055_06890 [Corynebacterium diphtheriae bv. mitis]CAB0871978.1 hypothetical protein FRC0360_01984 [Corynebacterium diphtheriae]CAB1022391.1 hypothetical protein FRC0522_01918 [Corynebacterium diphtheriae]